MSFRPKKRFGQNFLTSSNVVKKIITAGNIKPGELIIEIGPGKGILTKALIDKKAKVIAIEKDNDLIPILEEKFKEEIKTGLLTLVNEDVRDFLRKKTLTKKYKLIANIPYYLTGEIIKSFLENNYQPSQIVLLIQKEVGQRIVSTQESILSLSVKVYGQPKLISKVSKSNFKPQPKVDSVIISIENINQNNFKELSREKFFNLIKQAFSAKRKKITNNLSVSLETLTNCHISPDSRAEEINLNQWLCLAKKI